jgi:hypothetical protein
MNEESPNVDRTGIHIERDLAESVAIEEELDSNVTAPFTFPSPERRRTSGWVLVVAAAVVGFMFDGGWVPALGMLALAGWLFASSWPLRIDEHQALQIAGRNVSFPVGHASAAVTFKGWRSRPRWAVILYSASEPPDERALVVVDAVLGEVVEDVYTERIPGI